MGFCGYYLKIALLNYIYIQNHEINVGIWYKKTIYNQARTTKNVLHHGNIGGSLHPIHVYLLRSFIDARRTKMGIKYVLPSPHTSGFATAAIKKNWGWVLAQHNSTHKYIHQPPATEEVGSDQAPIVSFYSHHHRHDLILQICRPRYYCSVQSWDRYQFNFQWGQGQWLHCQDPGQADIFYFCLPCSLSLLYRGSLRKRGHQDPEAGQYGGGQEGQSDIGSGAKASSSLLQGRFSAQETSEIGGSDTQGRGKGWGLAHPAGNLNSVNKRVSFPLPQEK